MKKIVLSLAGVMAAVAFAPEASAVPVFARQTGMACSACHFQHFPLLNGFGRAFKANGFSMMGSQDKVEGEHLSIPATLNMAVLTSTYIQSESNDTSGAGAGTPSKYGVPGAGGELSIFYGGRVADGMGFLSEFAAGDGVNGADKLAMFWPVGSANVGFVGYTGGQGAAYSFELLNTGAADTHKLMGNAGAEKQHVAATSAASWLGARTDATGLSAVVNSDMGFLVIGKFAPVASTGKANDLPLTYVRAAAIMDLGGWDTGFGVQNFSGTAASVTNPVDNASYKATIIDAQAQGEVGGMSLGLYASYGTAPADVNGNKLAGGWSTTVRANGASQVNVDAKSTNVAATLELIPGVMTVQGGLRFAKIGALKDNATMIGLTYELAQNIELGLNYTTQSGSAWDAITTPVGKTMTTGLLEVLF